MIRLEEISRFVRVKEGEELVLASGKRRLVRLELNTAEPCQLTLQTGVKDVRFLANVSGRETLTFVAEGPVAIHFDCDGEVWAWCPEMETTSVVLHEAKTFTKIAERSVRNPDLERVAQMMEANARRREALLLDEIRQLRSRDDNERKAPPPAAPDAGAKRKPPKPGKAPPAPPDGEPSGDGGEGNGPDED